MRSMDFTGVLVYCGGRHTTYGTTYGAVRVVVVRTSTVHMTTHRSD